MLTTMRTAIDVALRVTGSHDTSTLRFASGFAGGIIESIEGNLHRGETPAPKSSIILP
jgi:hypothetical protein